MEDPQEIDLSCFLNDGAKRHDWSEFCAAILISKKRNEWKWMFDAYDDWADDSDFHFKTALQNFRTCSAAKVSQDFSPKNSKANNDSEALFSVEPVVWDPKRPVVLHLKRGEVVFSAQPGNQAAFLQLAKEFPSLHLDLSLAAPTLQDLQKLDDNPVELVKAWLKHPRNECMALGIALTQIPDLDELQPLLAEKLLTESAMIPIVYESIPKIFRGKHSYPRVRKEFEKEIQKIRTSFRETIPISDQNHVVNLLLILSCLELRPPPVVRNNYHFLEYRGFKVPLTEFWPNK